MNTPSVTRALGLAVLAAAALAWSGTRAEERPRDIPHDRDGSVMVAVSSSEFLMGTSEASPDLPDASMWNKPLLPSDILLVRAAPAWSHADERPAHTVRLRAFAIDRTEVTNGQYRRFLAWIERTNDHRRCHPTEPRGKEHTPRYWRDFNPLLADPTYSRAAPFARDTFIGDDKPVVGVDWYDAYAYAAWVGKRLPTEAEWEKAARGTDERRWPWGNDWRWGRANTGGEKHGKDVSTSGFEKDGYIYPAPVGSFADGASPYGAFDMAGNVEEWCADWYASDAYAHAAARDPKGPASGRLRVVRGGSSRSSPSAVRTAARSAREPDFRTFTLGFRCAKDL